MKALKYMPQLDALRTLAVMAVITHHWLPHDSWINQTPNGAIGVTLFFVLSGFLITQILLLSRWQVASGQLTNGEAWRIFLFRRTLRIFPLYFLFITLIYWLLPNESDISRKPAYYFLYAYNLLLHQTNNWADLLSPFWTLAVEEQFYLVWPWVVLFTPTERLKPVIIACIGLGVLSRVYYLSTPHIQNVLTHTCLDAFGLGALWAYLWQEEPHQLAAFRQRLNATALVALVSFIWMLWLPGDHPVRLVFQRLVLSILSLYLVAAASMGVGGTAGRLMENPVVLYLGKISYGLYVYHMVVSSHLAGYLIEQINRFYVLPPFSFGVHVAYSFALLVAIASLSWYIFEKPFNNLKRYFTYANTTA